MIKKLPLSLCFVLTCVTGFAGAASVAPPSVVPVGSDPGMQLNQTRAYLEQQQRLARLQAEKEKAMADIETVSREKEQADQKNVTFTLHRIDFDPSVVFTPRELDNFSKDYIGKKININALYDLTNKINEAYSKKGYVVCRAFLGPQRIHAGVVHIRLIEGKTGTVTVTGNKSTKASYIKNRLPLQAGTVSNLKDLSKDILWFNGTNDVQLRIKIVPGTTNGTTDYVITAYEPKKQSVYALVDTHGADSTGCGRDGLGWSTHSRTGRRDNLNLYYLRSNGSNSGSVSYSIPITKRGLRFGALYSRNSITIRHGALADLDVEGSSHLYSFSLTQPLHITNTSRIEASLEWAKQHSQTDFMSHDWVDDDITRWTGSIAITQYNRQNIWYQRHSFSKGSWDNIVGISKDYGRYNLDFLWQHVFTNHHVLTTRLSGQLSNDHYLPSSDQFYIGGVNTVRGYKENILSGDKGFALSLEYAVPWRQNSEWFGFFDMGGVYGDNAFEDNTLMGAGIGYRLHMGKRSNATLAIGYPFEKELNHVDQGSLRAHLAIYHEI